MLLTTVGTGTAAPEPDRVCSGHVIEADGLRVLFDCGPGVVQSMARTGIDWRSITHLAITHFHNDHIGDISTLFFAWAYGMRPPRDRPLTVIGPPGTAKLLDRIADALGGHVRDTRFESTVRELEDGDELRLSDVARLRARKTPHTPESLAYRVDSGARSFCYTGDTGASEEIGVFAQNVDALLIECSMPDDEAMDAHLTPTRVAAMARLALPRRLIVTHVYPQLPRDDVPALVRSGGWPAAVEVAYDGARYTI